MPGRFRLRFALAVVSLMVFGLLPMQAAASPLNPMQRTWMRTDYPVSNGQAARTWMWGPQENAYATDEQYLQSPDGEREVIYYDKARMEVSHPDADANSIWYVTNGLLVVELVSGRMQLGDSAFDERSPAEVNVAGDLNDPAGPTYATIGTLLGEHPIADGSTITQRVDRAGNVTHDPSLAGQGVTAAYRVQVPGIDHQIASVFWEFMHSEGLVWDDGAITTEALFVNPFYATGYPIAEAYWAEVQVDGVARDVLMQCFQRRCLTYTPGNESGWQVEAGNVGLHYYQWRYGEERPSAPKLSVVFNLSYDGEMLASTATHETFLGEVAVGNWETITTDGVGSSHGMLIADHTLGSIDAIIFQDWPFPGIATLAFTYDISSAGVYGEGTLSWSAYLPAGIQSGTVSFSATSSSLDVWDIELDEIPPVLFTD